MFKKKTKKQKFFNFRSILTANGGALVLLFRLYHRNLLVLYLEDGRFLFYEAVVGIDCCVCLLGDLFFRAHTAHCTAFVHTNTRYYLLNTFSMAIATTTKSQICFQFVFNQSSNDANYCYTDRHPVLSKSVEIFNLCMSNYCNEAATYP
uniref:Uncharacterized protein n=1 Tax=Glossina pallidipes TaxID=7398 RepID=A0A1B0AB59_GLOPL